MSTYVGAILAGGRGTRLGPLGLSLPKALVPVANRPLIAHHLDALRRIGVRDVLVVVGPGGDRVSNALGDGADVGVHVRYVEQGEPLGSAHAVARLAPYVHGPLVLILGDYYFEAPALKRMLGLAGGGARSVMAAKREPDRAALAEACVLETDGDGRVLGVVEKPKSPATDLKGCGVYVLQPAVFDAIARTPRTALRDEYELTVALDLHVRAGGPLVAAEVIEADVNVTRTEDVLRCNLAWLARSGRRQLIGAAARIPPGTALEDAVVGDNVAIEQPTVLRRVVIFEGARIGGAEPIEDALVTRDEVLHCRLERNERPEEGQP